MERLNEEKVKSMQKRLFLPKCIPINIHNVKIAWDIDTNEQYMLFYFNGKLKFYNEDSCVKLKEINKDDKPKKKFLDKIIYPKFVLDLKNQLESNKHLEVYKSYIDNKSSEKEYFYILIDIDNQMGYTFYKKKAA